MKLTTAEGVLSAVEKEDGKSTYMMDLTDVTKKNGNLPTKSDKDDNEYFADIHFSKVAKDYTALKNQKVKVLYKGTDEVFGVYALSEDNTALASVLGNFEKDTDTRIKFDGSKYNVKKDAEVKLDTEVQKNVTVANYVDEDGKYNKGLAKAFDAKAVSNDGTGKINLLDVESFSVAQVTYVGKDYINVTTVAGAKVDTKLSNDDANYGTGKINLLDVESFSVAQVTYVGKDYINVTTVAGAKVDTKLSNDDANYPEGLTLARITSM